MNKNDIKKLDKFIGVENIASVYFGNGSKFKTRNFSDTMCTAMARVFFNKKIVVFNNKHKQLCPGADYFFKLSRVSKKEAIKTYVQDEHVFCNENVCQTFLKQLPKFPKKLINKDIVIKPFEITDKPEVVIMLLDPAKAGRVLGLMNYGKYKIINLNPGQPTCVSLFAPLVTQKMHVNFIDYYDRYYQGNIGGKNIWPEDKLIISLKYQDFLLMVDNLGKSPHGSYKPRIYAQEIGPIREYKFNRTPQSHV